MIAPDLAAFLESGVSIHIATRDAALVATGARVAAVRVTDDGTRLTVFVPNVAAAPLLDNLKANGQAAVAFGRPSDDRAFQVKGVFEKAAPATARDRAFITAQWNAFLEDLSSIGFAAEAAGGWHTWPAVAVRLRVTAVFAQTPGPGAGAPIP